MIKRRNNLDEFQEQKLLKIESNGVWLAFWLLIIVFAIQYAMEFRQKDLIKSIAGEFIVLICLSFYLTVASLKHGIWGRKLKANKKNNSIISLLASIANGILIFVSFYFGFDSLKYSIIFGVIAAVVTFILAFLALELTAMVYRKRLSKLEDVKEIE